MLGTGRQSRTARPATTSASNQMSGMIIDSTWTW